MALWEQLRIAALSESTEGEWTPHLQMDLYCPQTRKFPGVGTPRDTSTAVLAGVAISAGAAAQQHSTKYTGLVALLNRQFEIWEGSLAHSSD